MQLYVSCIFMWIKALFELHQFIVNRTASLICFPLSSLTMISKIAGPLVKHQENRTLPVVVWLPYEIESNLSYWLSYAQQATGILLLGTCLIGSSFLMNGFVYQICSQLEILGSRLHRLPQTIERLESLNKPYHLIRHYETAVIGQSVEHHLCIFRFVSQLSSCFTKV